MSVSGGGWHCEQRGIGAGLPILFNMTIFDLRMSVMDDILPIDDPNNVASLGWTTFAPVREDRMELEVMVPGQVLIISDFPVFN